MVLILNIYEIIFELVTVSSLVKLLITTLLCFGENWWIDWELIEDMLIQFITEFEDFKIV